MAISTGGETVQVNVKAPHDKQALFINSSAKRRVIRAGRRGGKTVGVSILAVREFLAGKRVLYAAPTGDQMDAFWHEVKLALQPAIDAGLLYKNEQHKYIEVQGTKNRIRAKTAWDADSLRGDYADVLILDEFQLMNEETWERVGAPMMLDSNGIAIFIYTPPSLRSRSRSKARDPRHAAKLFQEAREDESGDWEAFHFTSYDNPTLEKEAFRILTKDMTERSFEQEILAEDKDDDPNALWKREQIDANRLAEVPLDLVYVVLGVDPPGGKVECGILVGGIDELGHIYILDDRSLHDTPERWGSAIVSTYREYKANLVVAEINFGGDMVERVLRSVSGGLDVLYEPVQASRGKHIRAEPVAARYEQGMVHHVGDFPILEDEMCTWVPFLGMPSPNRLDALVWCCTKLIEDMEYEPAGVLIRSSRPSFGAY